MNEDVILKGFVSVAALYAAANPWFRHHNTADPADLSAILVMFVAALFAIGHDGGAEIAFLVALGCIVAALAAHLVMHLKKIRLVVAFGAGRRHYEHVHASVLKLAEAAGIAPEAVAHDPKRPWLVVLKGVAAKPAAAFNKTFDKALRGLLGLEFRRFYPATIAVVAFLAAVWRYL